MDRQNGEGKSMCGPERLVFPHWRKSCGLWNCYQYYDKIIFFTESMKPVIGDFIPWCGQLWIHTLVEFLASNPWVYSKSRINVQCGTWSTEALSLSKKSLCTAWKLCCLWAWSWEIWSSSRCWQGTPWSPRRHITKERKVTMCGYIWARLWNWGGGN